MLNLTPDSYNAVVNLQAIVDPNSSIKFAQVLFDEKS